jgi:hypothetical protein
MEIATNNLGKNLQYTNTLYTPAENFSNVRYMTLIHNDLQHYNSDCQSNLLATTFFFFLWIPFYLQAVQIHSANGVKLLEA